MTGQIHVLATEDPEYEPKAISMYAVQDLDNDTA